MKNKTEKKLREMKTLEPEEMIQIRGGGDKPKRPKSPSEVIILI